MGCEQVEYFRITNRTRTIVNTLCFLVVSMPKRYSTSTHSCYIMFLFPKSVRLKRDFNVNLPTMWKWKTLTILN